MGQCAACVSLIACLQQSWANASCLRPPSTTLGLCREILRCHFHTSAQHYPVLGTREAMWRNPGNNFSFTAETTHCLESFVRVAVFNLFHLPGTKVVKVQDWQSTRQLTRLWVGSLHSPMALIRSDPPQTPMAYLQIVCGTQGCCSTVTEMCSAKLLEPTSLCAETAYTGVPSAHASRPEHGGKQLSCTRLREEETGSQVNSICATES